MKVKKVDSIVEIETNCRSGKCHATFVVVIDGADVTIRAVEKPKV